MRVGIHSILHKGFAEECVAVGRYEAILDYNGIPHERLDAGQPGFWERIRELDLFIFPRVGTPRHRQVATAIMPVIENVLRITCYPDMKTSWHYDDKVREYYLLEQCGFPVIPTRVFWDRESALEWTATCELPLVFKLKGGASSENVVLVGSRRTARRLVERMFTTGIVAGHIPGRGNVRWKDRGVVRVIGREARNVLRRARHEEVEPFADLHRNYILVQRFLPGNPFDTRVTVIGKRAFMSRRFVRANDFRASGGNISDWSREKVDLRCIRLAFSVSERLGFQCQSYDFLYDGDRSPMISEISYISPDWTVWTCPGYWDAGLVWHEGHVWPQFALLCDLLHDPDLRQPEMVP